MSTMKYLDRIYGAVNVYPRLYLLYRHIELMLEKKKVVNIADFGAGDCAVMKRIASVFAEDIKRERLFLYAIDAQEGVCVDNIHFFKRDLTKNINLNIIFDLVISTHVLEHIPIKKRDCFINNIIKHTQEGSIIYIETPSQRSKRVDIPKWLKSYFIYGSTPFNFFDSKGDEYHPHVEAYSPEEITKLIESSGNASCCKKGYNRNLLAAAALPITSILSLITRNNDAIGNGWWAITGWCSYSLCKIEK